MGPDKNSGLFHAVAEETLEWVDAEYIRRNLVVPTLTDLAEQFDQKDNTPNPVTEPTLFARLYALSVVQRSRMGITGFDPLSAFEYGGSVEAKAAPYHDEFHAENNGIYRTRAIQFMLPDQSIARNITIFGLNIYEPGFEDSEPVDGVKTSKTDSGIVVVDRRGAVTGKKVPVSGETVVFAVHNRTTNDAKVYQATLESATVTAATFDADRSNVVFENDESAAVRLPDGRKVIIKQLSGELLQQVMNELEASLSTLKGLSSPSSILSDEERRAAQLTASDS